MMTTKATKTRKTDSAAKIEAELSKLDTLGLELSTDGKHPLDELDWELIKIGNTICQTTTNLRKLIDKLVKKGAKHG